MIDLTASAARANVHRLLDKIAKTKTPVRICGKRHNGILVSEKDWRAIQETLFLLSVPGLRKSIHKGMQTPVKKCVTGR
jgi:PHD/YefM family antitoxin component YafN of YafNO toxin-antitoxin module